jgi:hypothetical protein
MSDYYWCSWFDSLLISLDRLIDLDACAQWNVVPETCRLTCNLKTCDRRPVERDFMVNMKLNYLHVRFLLWLALINPLTMDPNPELVSISMDMLSLVVETIMLKDQIINSGTSLVWKVSQTTRSRNQSTYQLLKFPGGILRLVRCRSDIPYPCKPLVYHGSPSNWYV